MASAGTIRIEVPIEVLDKTDAGINEIIKNFAKLEKSAQNAGKKMENSNKKSTESVTKFDAAQEKTFKKLARWAKEKYQVVLAAKDTISPILSKINSGLRSFGSRTWKAVMKVTDFATKPIQGILKILKNPIFQAGAVLGVSIGFKDTIDTFKNFEAGMSKVKAVSGATDEEFAKLTEKAKMMGANTKFTATEAAEAMNYMGMAGWKTKDMLNGIDGIMNLASASGESLGTVSDIVTDALTAFGLKAEDSGHFADVLAAASSNANTNVSMMGETFKYVGPVAGALKYSIEDTALAIGLMANSGIKASMAGTSLRRIFTGLQGGAELTGKKLGKYHLEVENSDGSMRKLSSVMKDLRTAFAQMTDAEKTANAESIAGKTGMAGLLAIVNASEKEYKKLAIAIEEADGAAKSMSEIMLDNLQGAFTLLQSALDGVKISFGSRLAPYLKEFAESITKMMPDIELAINSFMNWFDSKVEHFKLKVAEMKKTEEWNDADFFGKISIAWDEIIAKPFSEWWNSTGKSFITEKAAAIGRGIGKGISTGVMSLLGIDVSEALKEGESVGGAFAKGLLDGLKLDGLKDKAGELAGGIVKNAGKVLPGGKEADLTSWLSAALITNLGVKGVKLASKGAKLGKAVMGIGGLTGAGAGAGGTAAAAAAAAGAGGAGAGAAGAGAAGGTLLAGSIIGSAGAGTGVLGLGANTAISLGAGNLAGGAALSAGALSGIGLGAIAGGAVGGATLISGGMDLYKGFKSEDEKEGKMLKESGAWKTGGVVTGATTGALIGSFAGPLGTLAGGLIGAGIGGIAGWAKSKDTKKEYEESVKAAEAAEAAVKATAEAESLALKQAKYESVELKNALAETGEESEEFKLKLQKVVDEDIKSRFGDIKFSMQEIKDVSSKIVFGDQVKKVTKFSDAANTAKDSFENLQASVASMEKLNWKASLGVKLSGGEQEKYKAGVADMVENAKAFIENKHYEATLAVKLLVGKKTSKGIIAGLDETYKEIQEKIDGLNKELTEKINDAMGDNKISPKEQEGITKVQDEIWAITQKVADVETDSKLQAIGIKYGGAKLDSESYAQMQEEIKQQTASAKLTYDEALDVGISQLNYKKEFGGMTEKEYNKQLKQLTDGYHGKIDALELRVESFQLDTVAAAYKDELDGIMPDIKGTTAEKLKMAMDEAKEQGIVKWTPETVTDLLGLTDLKVEELTGIADMMNLVAETFPKELEKADFTSTGDTVTNNIGESIGAADMGPISDGANAVYANTESIMKTTFEKPIKTIANVNVDWNYTFVTPTIPNIPQPNKSGTINVGGHANGGFVSGKQLSWVGEEGPEAIIPLVPGRRNRALSLYERAGEMLGIGKFAAGGIVGTTNGLNQSNARENETLNQLNSGVYPTYGENSDNNENPSPALGAATNNNSIQIKVDMNPVFSVQDGGGNENQIMNVIRKHIKEMADELGGEIANKLDAVFSNMPVKG